MAALSGVAALVVETVGYVVGRVIRTTGHAESADERPEQILRLLVGSNPSRVGRWLLLAGGLTLASIGFVVLTQPSPFMDLFFPIGVINGRPVVGMVVTLAWIGLAALPAYRGQGLLVSWALVCGPIYGVMVAETQTDEFMQLPLLVDAAQSAIPAVVLTGIISVLGYTAGAVVRHRGDRLSSG